jgi:Pvc16 N-terminal domain/Carboxypeptidase regulatory-like domain
MFSDVDETLRAHLIADMPIHGGEVDIEFDRPTREWSSRLSKPTLNLFLFDVRERPEFRDSGNRVAIQADGRISKQRPPLRIDLSYIVTAWAKEPADEHRILSRVLSSMYRSETIPGSARAGALLASEVPLLSRVMTAEHHTRPADLWGVLDNELHASLMWVVTTPLDVWTPQVGPLVRTTEVRFQEIESDDRETFTQIAGVVHERGEPLSGIANARVSVLGTAHTAVTGVDGHFTFPRIAHGDHTIRVELPGGSTTERVVTVPSNDYDIEA